VTSRNDSFHQWAHRQLVDLVEYKADAEGIILSTSIRRTRATGAQSVATRARRTESRRRSLSASHVVRQRTRTTLEQRILGGGMSAVAYSRRGGRATVNALKSGTVTPNRGFVLSD
jgi:putative transposase